MGCGQMDHVRASVRGAPGRLRSPRPGQHARLVGSRSTHQASNGLAHDDYVDEPGADYLYGWPSASLAIRPAYLGRILHGRMGGGRVEDRDYALKGRLAAPQRFAA